MRRSTIAWSARISSRSTASASAHGVDAAVDVEDVVVGERADDVEDRVGGAQVPEELAAQPAALAGAARRGPTTSTSWMVA